MRRAQWKAGSRPFGPSVAAVGVFDGVHVGHQALLRDAVAVARSEGVQAAVLTFEPDPESVLHPDDPPPRILSADGRAREIERLGVDVLVEVRFDEHVASMTADAFVDEVVEPALRPDVLLVGEDFRFGKGASGDVSTLVLHGARHGYRVVPQELETVEGVPVTATRIRALVRSGDVRRASRLLGREHFAAGTVVSGRGHGRSIGVPTANVHVQPGFLVPGDGVYAGLVRSSSLPHDVMPAAVSVGAPPSFPDSGVQDGWTLVEVHILDLDVDLAGKMLEVAFVDRIRDQRRFEDDDALRSAILADIDSARRLLGH